jgi:putative transposase
MKDNFSHIGLARLCEWVGITRQAYYQDNWKEQLEGIREELVLLEVSRIRVNHKRIGTRKLYQLLTPALAEHHIKMGRDKLFDLLSIHHLLIRRRRRNYVTTWSKHWLRKYPNLIRGFVPTTPNQLWVSDITYWKINHHPVYVTLITDAYSHQIVGYHLSLTLEAVECCKALEMALQALGCIAENLIHHSDRGLQYCSHQYTELLHKFAIQISMTESGDPLENAVAERVNGIIKEEYLEVQGITSVKGAMAYLPKAIVLYNTERPHMSISNCTPHSVHHHQNSIPVKRLWKNYYGQQKAKEALLDG